MSEGIAKKTIQEMMQGQIDASNRQIGSMMQQLEAAKQRELELLAVIERLADDWDDLLEDMELHGMHKFEPYIRSKAKFKNRPEPSQALREHDAKILEDGSAALKGLSTGLPTNDFGAGYNVGIDSGQSYLLRMAEERRKK